MRIDTGPGYRVYLARKGDTVYILLNGGDKKSQEADIKKAKTLWAKLES
ncbi:MAG: addiction module killer protein [Pseudomonadota bacterium]|nr:addiction module killer protein [Pseudomonadota bacterium]